MARWDVVRWRRWKFRPRTSWAAARGFPSKRTTRGSSPSSWQARYRCSPSRILPSYSVMALALSVLPDVLLEGGALRLGPRGEDQRQRAGLITGGDLVPSLPPSVG